MEQFIQGRYPTLEGGLLFWAGVCWWLLCMWLLWRVPLSFSLKNGKITFILKLLSWSALLALPLGLIAFSHPEYAYSTVFSIWQSLTGVLCLSGVCMVNFQEITGRNLADVLPQKNDLNSRLDRASVMLMESVGNNLNAAGMGWFGVVASVLFFFPWIGLLAEGGLLQSLAMHAIFCFGTLMMIFFPIQQKN